MSDAEELARVRAECELLERKIRQTKDRMAVATAVADQVQAATVDVVETRRSLVARRQHLQTLIDELELAQADLADTIEEDA